jgi:hypothetical protein
VNLVAFSNAFVINPTVLATISAARWRASEPSRATNDNVNVIVTSCFWRHDSPLGFDEIQPPQDRLFDEPADFAKNNNQSRFLESSTSVHRRSILLSTLSLVAVDFITNPSCAWAVFSSPSSSPSLKTDMQKLHAGLERLNFLLQNWDVETTICITSNDNPYLTDGRCERSPMKVMEYLGYKSVNDPLFKAEKLLQRLEPLISDVDMSEYLDAVEQWQQASDEASGMAYVSSWGEANPGGGKDRVKYFIERSKQNVITARDALQTVANLIGASSS